MDERPWFDWAWVVRNLDDPIGTAALTHIQLSLSPILLGLVIALPLGMACARWKWLYPPVFSGVNILYSIPSIALFFLLLPYTSFSAWTAIIPLTLYTLAILVPNVVDGLGQVPDHVRQAAVAMGFSPMRRLIQVELPVAVPVVIAGLRVAAVATVSMVSVASLVGLGGFGALIFSEGFKRSGFLTPILVGVVLSVALAFLIDGLLLLLQRWLTPWTRDQGRARRPRRGRAAGGARTAEPATATAGANSGAGGEAA